MASWPVGTPGYETGKDQYIHGLMCWGYNPAVGGPSSSWERDALKNLSWLMCADLWETETSIFWKRPGVDPTTIKTEVILLPCSASFEKEGSVSNSGRWSQWRYKAAEAPGQAADDLSILNELGKELINLYKVEGAPRSLLADPVANLYWGPYCNPDSSNIDAWGMDGSAYDDGVTDPRTGLLEASPHKVAKEMNGYFCPGATGGATVGKRVDGFFHATASLGTLQEFGGTSSGNWLYCVMYPDPNLPASDAYGSSPADGNRQAKRDTVEVARADGNYIGLYKNWAVCWPLNRRIIYNGAAVYQPGHPSVGLPLAPDKWVLAFDGGGLTARAGGDVADGYTAPGSATPRYPFIMLPEGVARIFGPGLEDGPFPEHYEPWETILTSNIISNTVTTPTAFAHARPEAYEHPGNGNPEFPIVGTSYRVTEHWQAGAMTRNLPWLCQLMPEPFVEISLELAGTLGISNGDMVEIKTQRTNYYGGKTMKARACLTKRLKPLIINGNQTHVIGAIWHFGYSGIATGDSANLLTAHIGDANTGIPESKNFICNVRKYPGGSWLS